MQYLLSEADIQEERALRKQNTKVSREWCKEVVLQIVKAFHHP